MKEQIRDKATGEQLGWVADGKDVFAWDGDKGRHVATIRDGRLFTVNGEPTDIWLANLDSMTEAGPASVAKFKKL